MRNWITPRFSYDVYSWKRIAFGIGYDVRHSGGYKTFWLSILNIHFRLELGD